MGLGKGHRRRRTATSPTSSAPCATSSAPSCETNDALGIAFPSLHTKLSRDVFFITTQELEDLYPDLTPKQREDAICREHGTVFLMQIG